MDFIKVKKDILSRILFLAGIYNMLWGAWVILFPTSLFLAAKIPLPIYPMIWQSVGLVVGVYGIGYIIASTDYRRHWPIVLVGFLGKVAGPFGIIYHVFWGELHVVFLIITLFNDLIWWIPFYIILKKAFSNTPTHTPQ